MDGHKGRHLKTEGVKTGMLLVDVLILFFGLCIGSFYNVLALRLLEGQSPVYPPSHCPHCHHRLSVLDLIPVLSYLFLLGRCRYCGASISPLYLLGEGLTSLSFYLVYRQLGIQWELTVGWVLASLLVLAVLTDLKSQLILDRITFPFLGLLLLLRVFVGDEPWWWYMAGGLLGGAVLLLAAWLSRGGMGGGDIKLYLIIGVALGPWLTLLSIGLASVAGILIGGILLLAGRIRRRQPIPFAPFIWFGVLTAYLYGNDLWNWYIRFWLE